MLRFKPLKKFVIFTFCQDSLRVLWRKFPCNFCCRIHKYFHCSELYLLPSRLSFPFHKLDQFYCPPPHPVLQRHPSFDGHRVLESCFHFPHRRSKKQSL